MPAPAPRPANAPPATIAAKATAVSAAIFDPLRILWTIAASRTPSALITPVATTAAAAHAVACPWSGGTTSPM